LTNAAGKHVYLEKPGNHNPYEGEMLFKSREKFGKLSSATLTGIAPVEIHWITGGSCKYRFNILSQEYHQEQ
jgi:hypothetical protein